MEFIIESAYKIGDILYEKLIFSSLLRLYQILNYQLGFGEDKTNFILKHF